MNHTTRVCAPCALKEWAVTCRALAAGTQIVLLRKGGLLDEDGVFHLEHPQFYLAPTWLHQEAGLLKAEHVPLLGESGPAPGESRTRVMLRHFASVAAVYAVPETQADLLQQVPHVWSNQYLDLRFGYKWDKPLLCVALRVYELTEPHWLDLRPQDLGCRSWVEWDENLETEARPVWDDARFQERLAELDQILHPTAI